MKNLALGALFAGLAACGSDGKPPVIVGDGGVDTPPVAACSPLTQMGCDAGQKCAWIEDQAEPRVGHIGCVPDGTVDVGQACMVGAAGPDGYSDCKAGLECVSGVCKTVCDHQGGNPKCDSNHACSRYASLFTSGTMTVAGVCDPKCDPLTQRLLTDQSEACGSMNPGDPTFGCYTFDNVDFTCAGIPMPARGLTDRMPAYGPASGGAYVNGCAAGYIPFFVQETGSMVAVCAGMCAPEKTTGGIGGTPNLAVVPAVNAVGGAGRGDATKLGKLHNVAAPAVGDATCANNKKGSEAGNCHFLWPYNIENNMLVASPYNDTLGVCFAFGRYSYDHDMNPGTTALGYPSCQSLPPKGTTSVGGQPCAPGGGDTQAGCVHGTADEWPCVPSTEGLAFDGQPSHLNPAVRDFRVGYGAGEGVRHAIH